MQHGLSALTTSLIFEYKDFRLYTLSIALVKPMADAVIGDTLEKGTVDLDVTVDQVVWIEVRQIKPASKEELSYID